jgi:hypothetical protein
VPLLEAVRRAGAVPSTSTGDARLCTFWADDAIDTARCQGARPPDPELDPRRPETQAMTGTDPDVSEILGHLEVETTEIRDLSPPSAAAAPPS